MKQLPKSNLAFKPSALACAISSLFITTGLTPLTAQANCSSSGNITTCDTPFSAPYKVSPAPSPTLNINGTQTTSGQAEWLFAIDQASGLSTINLNAQLTWDNIIYKLVTTPPGSLIGGAINIGNTSEHQGVSGSIFFESKQNSSITLNLLPESFNANETVSFSGIIINDNGSSATDVATARLNGNITINDVDHGSNVQKDLYGAVIRSASANSDIEHAGAILINGAAQTNNMPHYYGLVTQSYNYSTTYSPSYSFKNSGSIAVSMPGSSGYTSKGLRTDFIGAHQNILIENSGSINLTSTSTGALVQTVYISNDTASNIINFTNTTTGDITNQLATNNLQPGNAAIKYQGNGTFNLKNEGNITSHVKTSDNLISTDNITNSGTINGTISTYGGNDTFTNTAGSVSGLIDLGSGDDSLTLTGGTLQNVELGDGDDTGIWSGGAFTNFYGGNGADTLTITGNANWANIQSINGGNASGPDDGLLDTLAFENYTGDFIASKSVGWEILEARSSSLVTLAEPTLVMSSALGAGLFARSGGSFVANDGFSLTSNLTIDTGGSYLIAPGSASGATTNIIGNVSNSGAIDLANSNTNSALNITGDYIGTNGNLKLRTVLGDDSSATSRLTISGAASGTTQVLVSNLGGAGAQTINGIRIIETGSSTSGAFTLPGNYVSAGAYEYALVQRQENGGDNWYLASTYVAPPPSNQIPTGSLVNTPVYTPNLGAMLANQRAANTVFTSRLEDREGAAAYQQQGHLFAPWVRYFANKNEFDSLSQLRTKGHSSVMQLGTRLLSLGETSRLDIGIMGGYADYSSRTKNTDTGRKASSDMHGYSAGAFATWYAEPDQTHGLYVDSWLQWNHFDNNIVTTSGDKLQYKSKGVSASLEVGNDLPLTTNWWLQPQAQVTYQGVKADHYRDPQNVDIKNSKANYQTRLGVKTYLDISDGSNSNYRPYLAANWIHNTEPYAVQIADSTYSARGMKNIGEVKLGLEGKLNANHQVWINTRYARGGSEQTDYGLDLGWRYTF